MKTNFISTLMKIHFQSMNVKDGIVYLLTKLNVNTYANEGHIGVNECILTVMKQIWTQMNVCFL